MMQNFKISRDEAYDFLNTMFEKARQTVDLQCDVRWTKNASVWDGSTSDDYGLINSVSVGS